jgi:SAM-dependent methyltransferase
MKVCSSIPRGHSLYTLLQKHFGNLNDNPWSRVSVQEKMAQWLLEAGIAIPGKVFFEVGTGHKPIIPICFFLMGAHKFITVDLHKRMDLKLLKGVLNNLASQREGLEEKWKDLVSADVFRQRFDMLVCYKDDPELFLSKSGIQYLAPVDAGLTSLPDGSIDCHLSNTVMEHIPPKALSNIVTEAFRLLKKGGVALHFIDLSDHFQHQDASIAEINFLRYSESEWKRIAGNEFAYTNRLRTSDYLSIFREVPFVVLRKNVRQGSKSELNSKVPLNQSFDSYAQEDIHAVELRILLQKS